MFLASDSSKQIKQWHDLHSDVVENKENSSIVTFEGSHFLYRQYSREIIEVFKDLAMGNWKRSE